MQTIRHCAASAAVLALAAFTPAAAGSYDIHIGDYEELLEQLIEMDADDIAEMRADFAEARADIDEAIRDIEEAKEEVKEVPLGGMVAKTAFSAASATVSKATDTALGEVSKELDKAETELGKQRGSLGEAEYQETSGAIMMLREELDALQGRLDKLTETLKEA